MRNFEIQSVEITSSRNNAFRFISDPRNLPRWARAFASVEGERARLRTPRGEVDIALTTVANGYVHFLRKPFCSGLARNGFVRLRLERACRGG